MTLSPQKLALVITLAAGVQPALAAAPAEGYFSLRGTTHNGQQVANAVQPVLNQLLASGTLTSEQIKSLEKLHAQLAGQPGGVGATFEQLAGSPHAHLATATQNTTQQLSNQLLSTLRALPATDDGRFWAQVLGNAGSLDGQRGSDGMDYSTHGMLLGADWALDHAWRIGVTGAKSTSQLDALRFGATLDSWHLGAYAVRQDGPMALRLGAFYSSHAGTDKRNVEILGGRDSLKGRYDAQSQTAFAEVGYQLGGGDFNAEPFASLGYQRYHRDSFQETGGITALNVGGQTQQNLSSTLGVRLAKPYRLNNQMSLTPHLSTGWKHLYGEVDSEVRQSFRYAAGHVRDFTITGADLDRNSLSLQAGLDLALSSQHSLGLLYTAEAGTHSRSQGLTGQWQMQF